MCSISYLTYYVSTKLKKAMTRRLKLNHGKQFFKYLDKFISGLPLVPLGRRPVFRNQRFKFHSWKFLLENIFFFYKAVYYIILSTRSCRSCLSMVIRNASACACLGGFASNLCASFPGVWTLWGVREVLVQDPTWTLWLFS